ncbi:hypothetical protein I2486_15235 [Cellulophaga sp. E16_2]|uniref:hypothetical protein n=1 Tax=Cellulophaga sp. E16_2 TaxID=2789297 RepID=UPI001A92ACFE|nr:hypothetical protein [Cellulophaga sp. E16_2]MBO0592756.1 hypothetical protein [Cellulophaga sp. E16_2]
MDTLFMTILISIFLSIWYKIVKNKRGKENLRNDRRLFGLLKESFSFAIPTKTISIDGFRNVEYVDTYRTSNSEILEQRRVKESSRLKGKSFIERFFEEDTNDRDSEMRNVTFFSTQLALSFTHKNIAYKFYPRLPINETKISYLLSKRENLVVYVLKFDPNKKSDIPDVNILKQYFFFLDVRFLNIVGEKFIYLGREILD